MSGYTSPFWVFQDELLREQWKRSNTDPYLDLLTVLQRAREKHIPVTLDDVRQYIARQMQGEVIISERFVSDFISDYLRHVPHSALLDPFAGLGGLIGSIAQELAPVSALALMDGQREVDLAKVIYPDAPVEWLTGAASEVLVASQGTFDVIVGCVRLGRPAISHTVTYKGQSLRLHDEPDRIVAAQALEHLAATGAAIFVLTIDFLGSARAESLAKQLQQLGIFLDTALLIPRGAFEPASRRSGLLVVLKRVQPDRVFVGELSSEVAHNAILLKNLLARQNGAKPQLGALVKRSDLTTVQAVFAEQEIKRYARNMGAPQIAIADIVLAMNFARSHQAKPYVDTANSVYLPLIGRSAAVTSLGQLKLRPHNYVQIVLDQEKADAHYVAHFFNAPLGLLIRESLQSGDTIPHITEAALARAQLFLPDIQTQAHVLDTQTRITNFQTEIERLGRSLVEHPRSYRKVEEVVAKWEQANGEDSATWFETLPFPLASILWAYYAESNVERRVHLLLHFFEALAEYLATVLLSIYASDPQVYARFRNDWIDNSRESRNPQERPAFGFWNSLSSRLAKATRQLLDNAQGDQNCRDLFHLVDPILANAITTKDLYASIGKSCTYRNLWKGHGGIAGGMEHQSRLSELEHHLATVHKVISDFHATTWLIAPGASVYNKGVHHHTVRLLMGANPNFRTKQVETLTAMDTDDLYLLREGSDHPLRLLPFVRLIPPTASGRIYFYSSRQGSSIRWVSYQGNGRSDLENSDSQVEAALQLLSPQNSQENTPALP